MSRTLARTLVVALCLAAGPADPEQTLIDGIAAQVGNEVVLVSEIDAMARPVEERMRSARMSEAEIASMRAGVLDRLIERQLIVNVVERLELGASDTDVSEAIDNIARENGLSREQLEQSVVGHGLTFDEYRAKIRAEIERSKVVNGMIRSRVQIDSDEVQALYDEQFADQRQGGEEVHLRHLLVAFGADFFRDRETACALVEEAESRIEADENSFAELAREISDTNAKTGGELGWIHTLDLAPWMAPVVAGLEAGQLSGVVETRFGCNLLQLVERRSFVPMTFERARPLLENRIYQRKTEEEYAKWVDELRSQVYVEKMEIFAESPGRPGGS